MKENKVAGCIAIEVNGNPLPNVMSTEDQQDLSLEYSVAERAFVQLSASMTLTAKELRRIFVWCQSLSKPLKLKLNTPHRPHNKTRKKQRLTRLQRRYKRQRQ